MRVGERFGRPFPVAVGQWWARSGLVSCLWNRGAWDRPSGAAIHGAGLPGQYFRRSQTSNRIWAEFSGPAVSCWVQLWHGRMTDGIPGVCVDCCGPAGGHGLGRRACSICWLAIWSQPGMQWA